MHPSDGSFQKNRIAAIIPPPRRRLRQQQGRMGGKKNGLRYISRQGWVDGLEAL